MGEIKKYDESTNLFGHKNPIISVESAEVKSLQPGEFWSEKHDECPETTIANCALGSRIAAMAVRQFGKGNYSTTHVNGIIAILRKA